MRPPIHVEVADEPRIANVAIIVDRRAGRQQQEGVPQLIGAITQDRHGAPAAEILLDLRCDIDAATLLACDVDVLVGDRGDPVRIELRPSCEQAAERIGGEVHGFIAAEDDVPRAELRHLVLHFDVEKIDGEIGFPFKNTRPVSSTFALPVRRALEKPSGATNVKRK